MRSLLLLWALWGPVAMAGDDPAALTAEADALQEQMDAAYESGDYAEGAALGQQIAFISAGDWR